MNLDFLSPVAPDSDSELTPIARSPMDASAAHDGARFEVRDGWNVAVDYQAAPVAETVGWADMSQIEKLELQGSGEAIEAAAGFALPFGTAVRQDGAWWCRLTQTRALVTGAHPSPSVRERVNAADGVNVVDVTTNFAALTIVGPLARELFARFSAIDLRPHVDRARRAAARVGRPPARDRDLRDRGSLPVPVRVGDRRIRVVGRRRCRAPPRRAADRRRRARDAPRPGARAGGVACLICFASGACGAASRSSRARMTW